MARFLYLLLLIFATKLAFGQSGKYQINTIATQQVEEGGTVTISPYSIIICIDSIETVLPVIDVGEDRGSTYYILKGCRDGVAFMGYGMLTPSSTDRLGPDRRRYYSSLFIEIRARQHYSATRYSIYYDR